MCRDVQGTRIRERKVVGAQILGSCLDSPRRTVLENRDPNDSVPIRVRDEDIPRSVLDAVRARHLLILRAQSVIRGPCFPLPLKPIDSDNPARDALADQKCLLIREPCTAVEKYGVWNLEPLFRKPCLGNTPYVPRSCK